MSASVSLVKTFHAACGARLSVERPPRFQRSQLAPGAQRTPLEIVRAPKPCKRSGAVARGHSCVARSRRPPLTDLTRGEIRRNGRPQSQPLGARSPAVGDCDVLDLRRRRLDGIERGDACDHRGCAVSLRGDPHGCRRREPRGESTGSRRAWRRRLRVRASFRCCVCSAGCPARAAS